MEHSDASFDEYAQLDAPSYDDWMAMSEAEACDAILKDFGVPIEIFQKYPRLLRVANGLASMLLDWDGSYRRWAKRQGYVISRRPNFGMGKPGTPFRQFHDQQICPLLEAQERLKKHRHLL